MKLLVGVTASTLALGVSALSSSPHSSPNNTCGVKGPAGNPNAYTCPFERPCCSSYGYCGGNATYCAITLGCQTAYGTCDNSTAAAGNATIGSGRCGPNLGSCASDQCCSPAGYCGKGEDYCAAPDCLKQYGPACDQNLSPPGKNTSTIKRTRLGSLPYGGEGIYDCVNEGQIALTFDDGPYVYTEHLLDILDKYQARVTFMVTGNNLGKGEIDNKDLPWANIIKRMFKSGHQLVSHTWSHQDLCNITSAERKNEMYKNEMALNNILGVFPTYMRPPYSSCTAQCGCESDMEELGYHIIYYDVDTQDYLNNDPNLIQRSKDRFTSALAKSSSNEWESNSFLVIAHDIDDQTANNLTEFMLQKLLKGGYKPVTVGQCLGDDKANWYRPGNR